jgi:hypothetical protein
VTRTLGDLAHSLAGAQVAVQGAQTTFTAKAARMVTTEIRRATAADTGGDSRLSQVGKAGAKVGARYRVVPGAQPRAYVNAVGPYQLLERPTAAHEIVARGRRMTKRYAKAVASETGGDYFTGKRYLKGARALRFGGRFAASSATGGTRGKRTFERAVVRTRPAVVAMARDETMTALRKAW